MTFSSRILARQWFSGRVNPPRLPPSYGPPIDIWALATTALYLFIGHHPFHVRAAAHLSILMCDYQINRSPPRQGFAKMNLDVILNNNTLASKITNFSLSVKGYKYYTKLRLVVDSLSTLSNHHTSLHIDKRINLSFITNKSDVGRKCPRTIFLCWPTRYRWCCMYLNFCRCTQCRVAVAAQRHVPRKPK